MIRINNPFDISKDGGNAFIDGINFHIRNSDEIKRKIINNLDYYVYVTTINMEEKTPLKILDKILNYLSIDYEELTIVDEHDILDKLRKYC